MTLFPHKRFVDEKMHLISGAGMVVDVGGGTPFTKWLKEYEPLFAHTNYKTLDYNTQTNPDVVGDIHEMPFEDMSVDAIICSSVLEHVRDPIRAVQEMHRVLKPDGMLFIYVPSIHPYHPRPGAYPDYWRYFEDTLREVLKDFSIIEIQQKGGYFNALSQFIPIRRHIVGPLDFIAAILDKLFERRKSPTAEGFFAFAVK